MRFGLWLGLPVIAITAPVFAAGLTDIHAQAKRQDSAYAAAYQTYLAGIEKAPQGRAGLLPSVALNAQYGHTRYDGGTAVGYSPYGYTLTLTQPLYAPAPRAVARQGEAQAEQAGIALRQAEQDLILRTAQAYFEVLKAESAQAAIRSQQAAIAEQLAYAKRGFEVGTLTVTDTHEAQARADLAEAQAIEAANSVEIKRRALEKLIQATPPVQARWSAGASTPAPAGTQEAWIERAATEALGVRSAQQALRIAEEALNKQRADDHPKLNLAASFNDSRNGYLSGVSLDSTTTKLGLELSWSLYEGGRTRSGEREMQAHLDKARFDLEERRRQARQDAREAWLGNLSGASRIRALEAAVRSSQLFQDATRLGLEVGVRTGIDLLNAQQQLASATRDLDAARYDLLLTGLKLEAAVGDLTEADLTAADARLKTP